MKCNACDATINIDSRFCDMCGSATQQPDNRPLKTRAPEPQPPVSPPYTYAPPQHVPAFAAQGSVRGGMVDSRDRVMTVGGWMGTFLLLMIPLVNFILVLVWAFGGGTNRNRQNFVRAYILLFIIFALIWILLAVLLSLMGVAATEYFAI